MKFSPILLLVAFFLVEAFAHEHEALWQDYKVISTFLQSVSLIAIEKVKLIIWWNFQIMYGICLFALHWTESLVLSFFLGLA